MSRTDSVLLEVRDLKKYFPQRGGLLGRVQRHVQAVDGVTFTLKKGHTLGLVGESGCGKSTLGRAILQLQPPTSGEVLLEGHSLIGIDHADLMSARRDMQIPDHEFVVLWAGRFDPVKRIETVIKAAEIMSTVPTRFLLAGDGPHRPTIEQAIRLSSAARTVHLHGWQHDLGPLFAAADAFLFPSLTEGMPSMAA